MLDRMNRLLNDRGRDEHKYLDLSNTSANDEYVCETCGVSLALYPQARIANPHAGISYICPKCHNVTDSSLTGLPHADKIKPLDLAVPVFTFIPEDKGDLHLLESYTDHDFEPQEEEILKSKGATIISKKIEVKNDFA